MYAVIPWSFTSDTMLVAVDTETTGDIRKTSVYDPSIRMSHLSYWTDQGRGAVFSAEDSRLEAIRIGVLENPRVTKLFWNAKFDIPILNKAGYKVRGPIRDAYILAKLVMPNEAAFSLKHFSRKHLRDDFDEEKELKKYVRKHKCTYAEVPDEILSPYALKDAKNTFELYYYLDSLLTDLGMRTVLYDEMALLPAIISMERRGVRIDLDYTRVMVKSCDEELSKIEEELQRITNDESFNPRSYVQISKYLYGEEGHPTDKLALLKAGGELAYAVSRYREIHKARNTYFSAFLNRVDRRGKLHTSFNQTEAITGRMSSSKPNLQNIPRSARGTIGSARNCFVPRDARSLLVAIDYSQIEVRLAAHFSREDYLIEEFLAGRDPFRQMAIRVFGIGPDDKDEFSKMRFLCKRLTYAVLYGTGVDKFRNTVLVDTNGTMKLTRPETRHYIDSWWNMHPAIAAFREKIRYEVYATGGVRLADSRFVPVGSVKAHAALNYKIQGTAALIFKAALRAIWRLLRGFRTDVILAVHDELIFDMPTEELELIPRLLAIMEDRESYAVPITCKVEVGSRWGEKKPYNKMEYVI